MERSKIKVGKYCDSGNIIKKGIRKTKIGKVQIFKCRDCERRFTTNFGFEKKHFDEAAITGTMQLYFSGMFIMKIANHYELMDIEVSFKTIYNWISKYSDMTSKYINTIAPSIGN